MLLLDNQVTSRMNLFKTVTVTGITGADGKMIMLGTSKDYYFDNGVQCVMSASGQQRYTHYYGLDGAMVKNAFVDFDDKQAGSCLYDSRNKQVGNLQRATT